MQQDITKLCADSLRDFTNDKFGIKLKASHAHELVAALFGYKSRAALLADTEHSLDNLRQAEFIVLDPTPCNAGFVDQRLRDFQHDNLNAFQLAECFYSTLIAEKWLLEKVHPSFHDVAVYIAEQRQDRKMAMWRMEPAMKWDIKEDLRWGENGEAILTANVGYHAHDGERLRDSKYVIHLKRVAANLGYEVEDIHETRYTGNFRKEDFPEDIMSWDMPR